jgi:hypothetical protein
MIGSGRKAERRLVLQARLEGYLVALCWGVLWSGVAVAVLGLLLPDPVALIAQILVVGSAALTFVDRCALVNEAVRKYRRAMR